MNERLDRIRARYRTRKLLFAWRSVPPDSRDRVIADLEETGRETPALRTSTSAAADLLDTLGADGSGDVWTADLEDVEWLIREVESLEDRLRRRG